jgi:hypothetical protein
VEDTSISNEQRASGVESFLLQEAINAEVVKEITITSPTNPNNGGKHLLHGSQRTAERRNETWQKQEGNLVGTT